MHQSIITDDDDTIIAAAMDMMEMSRTSEMAKAMRPFMLGCFEPFRTPKPFHITRAWTAALNRDFMAKGKAPLSKVPFLDSRQFPPSCCFSIGYSWAFSPC